MKNTKTNLIIKLSGRAVTIPVSLVSVLALWWLASEFAGLPPFMLPSPTLVWWRFLVTLQDGSFVQHTLVTLVEVLLGLLLGVSTAVVLGYAIAKSQVLEQLIAPYVVASQAVPIVALAPLLVIWFGPGLFSKVLAAALIVFFPILVNTVVGVRGVPEDLQRLMLSLHADRWQTLRYLEIPASMPVFLGGLRVGATLAVIGAVVGEFVGADRGLGFLINIGRGLFDTALVFVAIFALVLLALGLYGAVALLESRVLRWQQESEGTLRQIK